MKRIILFLILLIVAISACGSSDETSANEPIKPYLAGYEIIGFVPSDWPYDITAYTGDPPYDSLFVAKILINYHPHNRLRNYDLVGGKGHYEKTIKNTDSKTFFNGHETDKKLVWDVLPDTVFYDEKLTFFVYSEYADALCEKLKSIDKSKPVYFDFDESYYVARLPPYGNEYTNYKLISISQ